MSDRSLAELQQEVREVKEELAARDGELPLGLSVFYRGSLILGSVGLFGAGCFALLLAIVVAAMSAALVPLGALKVLASVIIFGASWTWFSVLLLKATARITLAGLRRVLEEGTGRRPASALSPGGSSTPVPAALPAPRRACPSTSPAGDATLAPAR